MSVCKLNGNTLKKFQQIREKRKIIQTPLLFGHLLKCPPYQLTVQTFAAYSIPSKLEIKKKLGTIKYPTQPFTSLQMIILPFIPILALLIQTSFALYDILQYRSEVNEIESQVNISFTDSQYL